LERIYFAKFQSAPHFSSEANAIEKYLRDRLNEFQSAPHFSSEANTLALVHINENISFNPRLTSAARRTGEIVVDEDGE